MARSAALLSIGLSLSLIAAPAAAQRRPQSPSSSPPSSSGSGAGASTPGQPASSASSTKGDAPKDADATAKAQKHFLRARELYQQGSYREAIAELESAHQLDPSAKDLVFNLATVSEKLGKIDDALNYMRQYAQMDLDAAERTKADAAIRRLEGAKKEVVATPPPPAPTPEQAPAQPARPVEDSHPVVVAPSHGKFDGLTVVTAILTVGGVGVGTVFGLKAMSDRPGGTFVTGRDGSYADLQTRATHAHHEAQIADLGFAVGAAAAIATVILYFARTNNPDPITVGDAGTVGAAGTSAAKRVTPSPSFDASGMRIAW